MTEEDRHAWTRERLSEHLDGSLSADAAAAVEAHLDGCAPCAALLGELREVTRAARRMGPVAPPADLWPGIARAIGAADADVTDATPAVTVLRPAEASGDAPGRSGPGSFRRSRPFLAAAAVVLMAVSASIAWWSRGALVAPAGVEAAAFPAAVPAGPASSSVGATVPESLAVELRQLESVVAGVRDRLEPGTLEVLERNLLLIERAIEDSYQALALDPENEFVREHLERTYQRKVEFLRDVSRLAELAG